MKIQSAYDQWSKTYDKDKNLTRDLDWFVTRETFEDQRCQSLLEIGCGTGKNTPLFSKVARRVQAVDFSQGMIRTAKEKVGAENVDFSLANLQETWPFQRNVFDVIVCNLVLEHIQDLTFVFGEAARMLTKHGRFFISELHPFKQYRGGKANFQQDNETTEIEAFVHHISDFFAAAAETGFVLLEFKEWWHILDRDQPPRLASFLFEFHEASP